MTMGDILLCRFMTTDPEQIRNNIKEGRVIICIKLIDNTMEYAV